MGKAEISTPRKILVVDDNEQGLELLEGILVAAGYEVLTAKDGLAAMEALAPGPVALIISDILMPRMDGFQLCRFVKADDCHKDTKFFFYTGNYTDEEDEKFAISLGANRIIKKPIAPAELLQIIDFVMENEARPATIPDLISEDSFLAEHNIRLFNKLEEKVVELEDANRKLAASEASLALYSRHLEELVEERTKALMESQRTLFRQERLTHLGQVAGEVSNELRTPLATIANAGYYLRSILDQTDETVQDYLEIIVSEIERANRTIHNLLDITAIKMADRAQIAILPLITAVIERNPPPTGIELHIDSIPELQRIYADPEHIMQIVSNIINNAYQAMPEGGSLTIQSQVKDDRLQLLFVDTGCGIATDKLDVIFEPLVSLSRQGPGLGLPLARNLAELNDGTIEVKSDPLQGSIFTLTLPVYCPEKTSAE